MSAPVICHRDEDGEFTGSFCPDGCGHQNRARQGVAVTAADRYLESCATTADAVEGLSRAVARLYADIDPECGEVLRALLAALARAESAAAALDTVTS